MISLIGKTALSLALLASLVSIFSGLLAARQKREKWATVSHYAVYVACAAVLVASAALLSGLLNHDFSNEYVQHYSDTRMPTMYLFASFWGGQEGSLLFWALVLSVSSALAITFSRDRVPHLMPWVYVTLMTILGFFLALLVFMTSPFDTHFLLEAPQQGSGLNPVLQNYWMAIHPPSILTGYSTFAVPFAFGVAAIITGNLDVEWIKVTRRWLLISWMFLSLGSLLGARWAYEELGWGGYWAWDPVENAAILPWFTATALLHSVMIQERRGMLKRWNIFLLFLTFWLTIFGTFLTRSGMIASVHSFAQSSIGPILLGLVIVIALVGGGLLVNRWSDLSDSKRLESPVSREGLFLLNNWIFLAFMFVVLWGTIGPKLSDLVTGEDTALGPAWYNKFVAPMGLALLFAMSVGTLIAWRKASIQNFKRNFTWPFLLTVLLTPCVGTGYYFLRLRSLQPETKIVPVLFSVTALFLCLFGIAVISLEFWRGIRSRRSKKSVPFLQALYWLLTKHRRRYGGYLVHLGFILICLGFSGNAFKVSQQATMEVGQSVQLGDYLVTYQGLQQEEHPEKFALFADLSLQRCHIEDGVFDRAACGTPQEIRPARFDYNDYSMGGEGDPMKRTSEIAILSSPLEDVYITLSGWRGDESQIASFEMYVNPLTMWIWIGGLILVISVVFCMWPERVPMRKRASLSRLLPVVDVGAMLFVVLVPAILLLPVTQVRTEEIRADQSPPLVESSATTTQTEHADMALAVRTEGSAEVALYEKILCGCENCGLKSINHCQTGCAWGRRARGEVDEMLLTGMGEQEILDDFASRYGAGVLAIPDSPGLVWWIPFGAILLGGFCLMMAIRGLVRPRPEIENADTVMTANPVDDSDPVRRRLEAELAELD